MTMDFTAKRLSYEKGALSKADLPDNPATLLQQWINEAIAAQVVEPYAISLATCGKDYKPAVRTVLMRELVEQEQNGLSIVFYTNYDSAKGHDLAQNPHAEALFFWHSLERQVRISGTVSKLDATKSDAYFHARPHDSQVAAWVSEPQSGVVANREVMQHKFDELHAQYADQAVPRPAFWGGYALLAAQVEFWQGRANRMHDRMQYTWQDNAWTVDRLLP